jgi:hypothetical protein
MGWCTGSGIAEELWENIREYIPPDKRQELAKRIVDLFSSYDADCWEYDGDLYSTAYPWEDEE